MEKERFLVEVTVRGEKGWKAIHMFSYLLDTPIAIRVREKRGKGLEG